MDQMDQMYQMVRNVLLEPYSKPCIRTLTLSVHTLWLSAQRDIRISNHLTPNNFRLSRSNTPWDAPSTACTVRHTSDTLSENAGGHKCGVGAAWDHVICWGKDMTVATVMVVIAIITAVTGQCLNQQASWKLLTAVMILCICWIPFNILSSTLNDWITFEAHVYRNLCVKKAWICSLRNRYDSIGHIYVWQNTELSDCTQREQKSSKV